MRDEIAEIIESHKSAHELGYAGNLWAADAIIKALPGMVSPLVWDSDVDGTFSIGGCYEILQNDLSKFCFAHHPTDFCSSYFETLEAAKAAADTHNRARIMSAFTVGGA